MQSPQDYWNQYYEKNTFQRGMGPRAFLKENIGKLHVGKTLEIAMGEGQEAVFLASHGHQVHGFDLSQTAVNHALELAKTKDVNLEVKRTDLDLYMFGLMEYDNILMFHFRPSVERYYGELARALKQGGMLMIEAELIQNMKEIIPRGEEYRDLYFRSNEILRQLRDLTILYYREDRIGDQYLVQCIARKSSDKDASKYKLFDMQTKDTNEQKPNHILLAEQLFKK